MGLITTNVFAAMPVDYSCQVRQGSYDAVTITKQNDNILHIALRLDPQTCEVDKSNPMVMYWTLNGSARNGVVPCQGVSSYEYSVMGLRPSNADVHNANKVSIYYKKLADIAQDFNHKSAQFFEVETFPTENGCQLDTTLNIDERDILLDRLHIEMSIFSIKGVEFYLKNNLVFKM